MKLSLSDKNLQKAIEVSYAFAGKKSLWQRCRHFSYIFDRNRLISMGVNSYKTHPLNLKYNYINKKKENIGYLVGTHSEMSAVIKLGLKDCSGLTLVNIRINRKNELDYSFPCSGCRDMISKMGFKNVFYTTKNKKFDIIKFD